MSLNFFALVGRSLLFLNFKLSLPRLMPATLLEKRPDTGAFCEFCEIFKNTFLIEYFQWLLLYIYKEKATSQLELAENIEN